MSDVTGAFEAMVGDAPENDPTAIGNLLQAHCGLKDWQVSEALAMQQKNPSLKLGDAVVACGHASPTQVADALEKQRRIRDNSRGAVADVGKLADWVADKLARRR